MADSIGNEYLKKTRVLITGVTGKIGKALYRVFYFDDRYIVKGISTRDFDICNKLKVETFLYDYRPEVIIHCAAYTAVDEAEQNSKRCYDINVVGTQNIVRYVSENEVKIIYLSSDYIFDGQKDSPYEVNDKPNPINVYGYTKLLGEELVTSYCKNFFIVRTSCVFGGEADFISKVYHTIQNNETIKVVDDLISSPTYSHDIAVALAKLSSTDDFGIYHITNEGYCSRYHLAKSICEYSKILCNIIPCKMSDINTIAKRPLYTVLSCEKNKKMGLFSLPSWKDSLKEHLIKYKIYYNR